MTLVETMEKMWQEEYQKYREEKEFHRISFILTKKCKCKSNECRHYESEREKFFEKKVNALLHKGIMINAIAYKQAIAFKSKISTDRKRIE